MLALYNILQPHIATAKFKESHALWQVKLFDIFWKCSQMNINTLALLLFSKLWI